MAHLKPNVDRGVARGGEVGIGQRERTGESEVSFHEEAGYMFLSSHCERVIKSGLGHDDGRELRRGE